MRKLATIRIISDIQPIIGADSIECAQVDGWKVVIKKGEFKIGDLCTYFEVDSWVPEHIAPFLCKDKREFNGVPGARLRTVKLRGQISQGLLLPAIENKKEGDDYRTAWRIEIRSPYACMPSWADKREFPIIYSKDRSRKGAKHLG